jgi:ornithine cyclodeaminase/alanine dehydrogenase-like protein (mu-crystallin family)
MTENATSRSGTRLLARGEVAALLDLDECIAAVEGAFRLRGEGGTEPPALFGVAARGGGFHVKGALLELARPYFAVKANGNFARNRERFGMPTIQGLILLCDGENGRPLAVLDSTEITILRTGAATAVAARRLARPDARTATVVGCGNQGRVQLRALCRVLPLERAWVCDLELERASRFAADLTRELGIAIEAAEDLSRAVRQSAAVVTATTSRRAFLRREDVSPGTFVAAVGADSAEKQELEPELVAASTLVVDVLDQCAEIGELHHALAAGLTSREGVHAELSEIVAGRKPGRRSERETIVFDSTGTALQDVAAAALVYEKAVAAGRGAVWDPFA